MNNNEAHLERGVDLISVIIPTYNGEERIRPLLDSLSKQEYSSFEVIVSIDGSEDRTIELLKEFQSQDSRFRYIEQENKGRATCRNLGASASKGQFLYFVDDDMTIAPDHLGILYELILSLGRNSIITGLAELPYRPNQSLLSELRRDNEQQSNGRSPDLLRVTKTDFRLTSQLLCIPRDIFKNLGGFRDGMRDSEDFELGIRILDANMTVWFSKKLRGDHRDERTLDEYAKRRLEYLVARMNMGVEFPDYRKRYADHFPKEKLSFWKKQFLQFFSLDNGWERIFKSTLASKIIPKRILFPLLIRIIYATARTRFERL